MSLILVVLLFQLFVQKYLKFDLVDFFNNVFIVKESIHFQTFQIFLNLSALDWYLHFCLITTNREVSDYQLSMKCFIS